MSHWVRFAPFAALCLISITGCFSERAIPLVPRHTRVVRVDAPLDDTRAWLRMIHPRLASLLPCCDKPALLTEDLLDNEGRPIDVFAHFGENPQTLTSIFGNLSGLSNTAQATGGENRGPTPPEWPGFEDIWIPVDNECEFSGRIGWARRDGEVIDADCVIILPGLFGDNWVQRTRDVALALRANGIHAIALELRGFGRTRYRYPEFAYGYSVLETIDLLRVAAWLQRQPHVRRTGVVGFCWSAHQALIAAWEAGRSDDDADVSPALRAILKRRPSEPVLTAGALAFSPVLRFEEVIDRCERPWAYSDNPVLASLQKTIMTRLTALGHPAPSGNLREAIQYEFSRNALNYPNSYEDGLRYLRLLSHKDKPVGAKLDRSPIRALIVQGVDDPLTSAQYVAQVMATTQNRRVAALVLPGGGHVGFAPYARDYFYSLLLSFFAAEEHQSATPPEYSFSAIK